MKVLFVQKEGGIFGAENYQLKVIPGLIAKGVQIEFLRLFTNYQGGQGGEFIDLLHEIGVTTYEVNIGRYPSLKSLRKIKSIVKKGDYDIVHTHLIHADFHLGLIKKIFGLEPKLVSTKHGYDNDFTSRYGFDASKQRKTPYFLISRWAEKQMSASFTISNGLRNFFIETGLTSSEKMKLIHYGFDMPEYHEQKGMSQYRKAEKQLVIAGRLVGFKGHRHLIDAMVEIREVYRERVQLLIAGSGQLEEELKMQVANLGLEENIGFLGYTREVGAYMANSDIVVIPSISEGFGVVFLEAFAAKTPVVAWDVPSANELMVNEETGYLAKAYDVKDLARVILRVLENGQAQVSDAAYQRLKTYFTLDRMVEQTLDFYRNI